MNNDFNTPEKYSPSKSQRKREMTALQKIGENLVQLKASQLLKLELSTELLEQIKFTQQITKKEALRRQFQYLGKVMRRIDEETLARIKQYLGVEPL